jgi:hypothetical protein
MVYNPPHKQYASEKLDTASTVLSAGASAAIPVAGAIGGASASLAAGGTLIGGAVGGTLAGTGAAIGGTAATIGATAGAGAATAVGAGAAGSLAASAGATAATGIGHPIAIVLGLAAAGVSIAGAVKRSDEKKEARNYDEMYQTWQSGTHNSNQSYKQNLDALKKSYNQYGISSSKKSIDQLTTSLVPNTESEINKNRLT